MPKGAEEGSKRGMYRLREVGDKENAVRVQLLGSGAILRQVEKAAEWLAGKGIASQVWSVTSFNELRRDGLACERQDYLTAAECCSEPYLTRQLKDTQGPFVAATDYMKAYADQVRPYVPADRAYKYWAPMALAAATREKICVTFSGGLAAHRLGCFIRTEKNGRGERRAIRHRPHRAEDQCR